MFRASSLPRLLYMVTGAAPLSAAVHGPAPALLPPAAHTGRGAAALHLAGSASAATLARTTGAVEGAEKTRVAGAVTLAWMAVRAAGTGMGWVVVAVVLWTGGSFLLLRVGSVVSWCPGTMLVLWLTSWPGR